MALLLGMKTNFISVSKSRMHLAAFRVSSILQIRRSTKRFWSSGTALIILIGPANPTFFRGLPYGAGECADDTLLPRHFQDVGHAVLPNRVRIQRLYDRHALAFFVRACSYGIHFYS